MSMIGTSLDSINAFARSAIEASKTGVDKSAFGQLNTLPGLEQITSDLIAKAFGTVPTPVSPAAVPAAAGADPLTSFLSSLSVPVVSGGTSPLTEDLNKLLAASQSAAAPALPALTQQTATNIAISQDIQAQGAKASASALDLSGLGLSKELLPDLTPLFSVGDFSKGRSAATNSYAPATVGTAYDLNFLHNLGLSMAAADPSKKLSSFGIDEFLVTPLLALPGVKGISPKMTEELAQLDSFLGAAQGSNVASQVKVPG